MDKYRMLFSKTGRAIYISHLDLMRTVTRAFMRAECRLKYSEGFNPHPNISIALPLSVGCESICEIMDFKMLEDMPCDEIKNRLSVQFPEGIEVLDIYEPERKVKEIKWLSVSGVFEFDDRSAEDMVEKLNSFYSADSIVIEKKTKRGVGKSDIRPAIKAITFEPDCKNVKMNALISAQEPTLNPELLAEALRQLAPDVVPDFAKFKRLELYDDKMQVFR